jgi:predicted RNA-binding Zn-ribbon protein involved in translation (DUF1610 family)
MASKRRIRRKECEQKKRYEHEAHARIVACQARYRTHDAIAAYKCPHCSGWHIGHRSARKI